MSLLREIQREAISPTNKVSDLLRKCKILAYRLGNEDFKNWVDSELNGYESLEDLPSYRVYNNVASKGHFSGAFGSGMKNADIPSNCFPRKIRKNLTTVSLIAPIAEIESLVRGTKKSDMLQQPWDANFVAMFRGRIYENMVCVQAWKVIPSTKLEGIIDIVKTKILNFVLEIEVINPDAGEARLNSDPIPQEIVSQIFNIEINGNVGNLASRNTHSIINQKISHEKIPQEFFELLTKLKESNIENEMASEVAKKLELLGASVGTSQYKELYNELMGFVSNHVTVLGFLAPYIPMLTSYLS